MDCGVLFKVEFPILYYVLLKRLHIFCPIIGYILVVGLG